MKTQGEKISYIFPQLDNCALFSATIKKGKKYVPYCLHFFQVSHNFMKNCSCSVILSLFFSFPLSFLSFSPFFQRACCFYDTFSPSGHIYFPPPRGGGGGGYFPIFHFIDPCLPLKRTWVSPEKRRWLSCPPGPAHRLRQLQRALASAPALEQRHRVFENYFFLRHNGL
jgi:hypothetical protein